MQNLKRGKIIKFRKLFFNKAFLFLVGDKGYLAAEFVFNAGNGGEESLELCFKLIKIVGRYTDIKP